MKSSICTLSVAVALLFSQSVRAQEADPAFWLLMPYASVVSKCAGLGADTRTRLRSALTVAQKNSTRILPAMAWELIALGLEKQKDQTSEFANSNACEEMISAFNSPNFPTYFRQQIAAQFVTPLALTCLVKHPESVRDMKAAWLAAFTRQGFILSEDELNRFVSEAALPNSELSQVATLPLSQSDCAELGVSLFGKNFDEEYGETGIHKLFSHAR